MLTEWIVSSDDYGVKRMWLRLKFSRHKAVFLASILGMFVWVASAAASTGIVDWPTYLRAGPSRGFEVLQELARGAALDIVSCGDGWCSVRFGQRVGFVEQGKLVQDAAPDASKAAAANGCFSSRRSGYEDGEPFRYCPR